jgi:hypothetical protein
MKFIAGFSLGVFAPRRGKKDHCKPDDGYAGERNERNERNKRNKRNEGKPQKN